MKGEAETQRREKASSRVWEGLWDCERNRDSPAGCWEDEDTDWSLLNADDDDPCDIIGNQRNWWKNKKDLKKGVLEKGIKDFYYLLKKWKEKGN